MYRGLCAHIFGVISNVCSPWCPGNGRRQREYYWLVNIVNSESYFALPFLDDYLGKHIRSFLT